MRRSNLWMGALAILVALVARAILSELLSYLFVPVQRWYFHRYTQTLDPDPLFLPLEWVPGTVFPLLGSFAGGILAAVICRTRSMALPAAMGITVFLSFLAWWHTVVLLYWETVGDPSYRNEALVFLAIGILNGVVAFLACSLTQRLLAKRAETIGARPVGEGRPSLS